MGEWGVLSFFVDRVDLYMVSGERDKERLEEYGIEADRIAVTGASRYEDIGTFKHRYSVEESTRELGLQDDPTFRIFYAPQCTTRGSLSKQEKEQVTQALVEFAASHPNVGLIIKPHPSDDSGLVENLAAGRTGDDVVVVNRHELPYHCINAADVVITKYSTVGIEAMLFETLVVSVALDDATELQDTCYGDVAEQVQDVRVLQETLNQLRTDYERYATAQGNRREQFLRQKFTQSNNSGATVTVDTILDALAETERDEISTSF
jgi:UDP-N-acetylglucosamine 2-epimerase